MIKKLKTLLVVFENEIKAHEIPAFRGAIIHKVGLENVLFHNHREDGSVIYQYPFIQYKQLYGKPAIYCIDDGVDEIHKVFTQRDWTIEISDRKINLKIDKLDLKQFNMQVWDRLFKYRIRHWVALNSENYQKYRELKEDKEKKTLLKSILTGNIISMAKGIEWNIPREIELNIETIEREQQVKLKGIKVNSFDLIFNCNVFLPDHIGLGKSVTLGYGTVRPYREKSTISNEQERT
jgi:hypothetical protein